MRGTRRLMFMVVAYLLLCGVVYGLVYVLTAPPAYGWDASKSTNGVILIRESTDSTATGSLVVYCDYKGGQTWSPNYPPTATSSYARSVSYLGFLTPGLQAIEIPLVEDGGRVQLVSGSFGLTVPVLFETLRVSVVGTATVAGAMSLPSTMPVTLDSTLPVSIDSTLPVTIEGVGAFDASGMTVLLVVVLALMGYGVWWLSGGWS